jgi:hypothetical protein
MCTIRAACGLRLHKRTLRKLGHSVRWAAALLLLVTPWMACARDDTSPLGPPSLAQSPSLMISGRVLGPDGENICGTIGSGTMMVQLLNPEFGITSDIPFLGEQELSCPVNRYSLRVDPGTAHMRVTLPINPGLDNLPRRHLDDVEVADANVSHDVNLLEGTELGGSATLDGQKLEGVFLQVLYDFNPNFGVTNGTSNTLGPNGSWEEFFGRAPMVLQGGERYAAFSNCGATLGARLVADIFGGGFLFPTEVSALNCTLETGAATRFSHTFTRVVVTPMPGDIGGSFSPELFDRYGVGWGVQFPVAPGSSPSHNPDFTHLFTGGLLIGISPDRVLSGVDLGGEMDCGATCRDLGLNGMVRFIPLSDGRKSVTWRYSDATSAEGVGLEVTQVSVDGRAPNDYVLFRFSIRNTRPSTLTFHAGFFGDWDIDVDPFDDLGFTDLAGKLMYEVSQAETGFHVGTMLLGLPVSGNYFFTGAAEDTPSLGAQVQALSGALRREVAGPADLRYIHGAGPITLKKNERRDVWIAIVAGETKDQLLANAAAAEADVASSLNSPLDASVTSTMTTGPAAPAASRPLSRPICKNCKPQ